MRQNQELEFMFFFIELEKIMVMNTVVLINKKLIQIKLKNIISKLFKI